MNHLSPLEERHQHFLDRAYKKYGDQFSYEKFEYKHHKHASIITCKKHGDFSQNPNRHINNTYSCPLCHREARSLQRRGRITVYRPTLSKEEYLERLNLPEHISIDLTNYEGLTKGTVDIVCRDHGRRTVTPSSVYISANRCVKCADLARGITKAQPFNEVKRRMSEAHNGIYTYPDQEYVNSKSKIRIVCPVHGEFIRSVNKHLHAKRGCTKCTYAKNVTDGMYLGGYTLEAFEKDRTLAETPAYVYYFQIGDLYKIGISVKGVENRVKDLKFKSKKSVTVLQTHACSLERAFKLEQSVLKQFEHVRVYRDWSTELFSEDVLGDTEIARLVPLEESNLTSPS